MHYVPLRTDTSDLEEKVQYCEANLDHCQRIAQQVGVRVGVGDGFELGLGVGVGIGFEVKAGPTAATRLTAGSVLQHEESGAEPL